MNARTVILKPSISRLGHTRPKRDLISVPQHLEVALADLLTVDLVPPHYWRLIYTAERNAVLT